MMGLFSIFTTVSLILTYVSYPLIPKLYRLFEKLSTFQFLSNDYIRSVWNNIYVLVGVIVMFAIAIKLISSIVNPDTLTDNKKGVKSLYFRTVIAVIMIFIIPILFNYSFELQQKLVDSNFLISRVFGYKIAEGTDVGQLLAWTTFSSFCELGEDADATDKEYYNKVSQDIEYIGALTGRIKLKDPFGNPAQATQGVNKYGSFNYHSILCPLTGFVIVYELFLLCMDTLFRATKLAFLELMLPIVLGAFVFNPDILKKWAKEFISAYLTLFLKILAIGFMVISFVSIKGYIESDPFFSDWLLQGLFNVLFIIALLQLVKKIPDLINTIFGTHIKSAGGIKGRLGEMAGIGGIASKAWSSLGTGAKNLGKALAAGSVAAPVAAGAYGANAFYKHKSGGKDLRELKGVRQIKGIGSGIASAWKGGSPKGIFDAYQKGSAAPTFTADERIQAQNIRDASLRKKVNSAASYKYKYNDASGRTVEKKIDVLDENGNWVNSFKDPTTGKDVYIPDDVIRAGKEALYTELENQGPAGKIAAAKMRAQDNQQYAEGIKKKSELARQFLTSAAESYREANNMKDANRCEQISAAIRDGKEISQVDKAWLLTEGKNVQQLKDASAQISKVENESILLKNLIPDFDGNSGDIPLGTFITKQEQIVKGSDSKYNQAISTLSESTKDYLSSLQSTISAANPMLNGAFQNNASVFDIYNEKQYNVDGTVKLEYENLEVKNTPTGIQFWANVTTDAIGGHTGNRQLAPSEISVSLQNYVNSIKSGVVKTSYKDYDIDVVDFNHIADNIKSSPGTIGYYLELHEQMENIPNVSTGTKNRISKLEESGFLPSWDTLKTLKDTDWGVTSADFTNYEATVLASGATKGSEDYYKRLCNEIIRNVPSNSRAQRIKKICKF